MSVRSWLVATVVMALAQGCMSVPPQAGEARLRALPGDVQGQTLPRTELDVLVWNIAKARHGGWSRAFAPLVADVEVAMVQEAYDGPRMRDALEACTAMHWQMGVSFIYPRRRDRATGVMTGAVARPSRARVIHAPTREPLLQTPKAALLTTYPLAGLDQQLLVVNVHGINFRTVDHFERQLRMLAGPIDAHIGPVLFGGDLNTHHRPRLIALERFATSHGLESAFRNWVSGPRGGRRRPACDGRRHHLRWPLDHLYVRGLEVRRAEILDGIDGSDHRPLRVRVEVLPGAGRQRAHSRTISAAVDPG